MALVGTVDAKGIVQEHRIKTLDHHGLLLLSSSSLLSVVLLLSPVK